MPVEEGLGVELSDVDVSRSEEADALESKAHGGKRPGKHPRRK